MPLGKVPFLDILFLENEEQPSDVSQVKRSPHAKIHLFLSTLIKLMAKQSRGHPCPQPFN